MYYLAVLTANSFVLLLILAFRITNNVRVMYLSLFETKNAEQRRLQTYSRQPKTVRALTFFMRDQRCC